MSLGSLMHGTAGAPATRGRAAGGEESPPDVMRKEELHVVRAELVLAAGAARPLREVPLRPSGQRAVTCGLRWSSVVVRHRGRRGGLASTTSATMQVMLSGPPPPVVVMV
jgi:hypothetical protein